MLEALRPIGLDRINGNFIRTASHFLVRQIVIHNQLTKPKFFVDKEDLRDTYSQTGVLHLSINDLGKIKLPDRFDLSDLKRMVFPGRTVFPRSVELGSIKVGRGAVIGGKTKIGPNVEISEGAEIGPNCRIEFSEIKEKVRIGTDSKLRAVTIGENTELGPQTFINNAGLEGIEIGSSVKIGAGLRIVEGDRLIIESDVAMGDNVTVSTRVNKIGAGAKIESGTLIKERNINPGEKVRTLDAPDVAVAFRGKVYEEPAQNPYLPQRLKRMISALRFYRNDNYLINHPANCTLVASQSISRDPALFLYPQLHSMPEGKLVRIVGEREAVVFFNGYQRIYFGAKQIPEAYIAEEKGIAAEAYPRMKRFSTAMLTGFTANGVYEDKFLDLGEKEDCYGTTPLDKFYMLMDYLRVKLNWGDGQAIRFLDMGSGLGDVVKVASAFVRAEGMEMDKLRHQLAVKHAPESLRPNLHLGDFLNHDLSVYDLLYMHLNFANYNFSEGPFPFIKNLHRKLKELKPEAMLMVGPIRVRDSFTDTAIHDTVGEAQRILPTMTPVDLDLPAEIDPLFALFKK